MKVLQFVTDGSHGGGTNHMLQLLRGFKQTHDMLLLTQQDSYLVREAEKLGIQVVTGDFFRSRFSLSAIRKVKETIRQFQPDVIHCVGGRAAFFRSCVLSSVPSAYSVQGFHLIQKKPFAKIASLFGEFWSFRRINHIIFPSDSDRRIALGFKLLPRKKRYSVILNRVPKPQIEECKPEEKLGVGFVGRMTYQKNPQLFVEMLTRLPDVQATIVGGGELESEVKQLVDSQGLSNRVTFYGGLDHDATLKAISRFDVLVMTPRWECVSLLMLEAMFLRVPVVSTPAGGIPEAITHRQTGMLSKGEDADELAGFVKELLENDELREQIIENAATRAANEFEEGIMLRQIRETYQSLAETRKQPILQRVASRLWNRANST